MTHGNYSGDRAPAIVDRLFGENYEGPFSDWDEWHAAEYGAYLGFYVATQALVPELAPVLLGVLGLKSIKELVTGPMRTQVLHEKHYFGSTAFVSFLVVSGVYIYGGAATVADLINYLPV